MKSPLQTQNRKNASKSPPQQRDQDAGLPDSDQHRRGERQPWSTSWSLTRNSCLVRCRAYGARGSFLLCFPALTGWANVWRAYGAYSGQARKTCCHIQSRCRAEARRYECKFEEQQSTQPGMAVPQEPEEGTIYRAPTQVRARCRAKARPLQNLGRPLAPFSSGKSRANC